MFVPVAHKGRALPVPPLVVTLEVVGGGAEAVDFRHLHSCWQRLPQAQRCLQYLNPRWSTDGSWIAFQRGDSIRFDIFAVPATGGDPRQLTHGNNIMSGFAWRPDSRGIIYSSSRGSTMRYLPTLGLWQTTMRDGSVRRVALGRRRT